MPALPGRHGNSGPLIVHWAIRSMPGSEHIAKARLWHTIAGRHLLTMRIILFTGKGGVGKTSTAAATALRCAELGQRTIVFSTDIAHSLADSFDRPLAPEPVVVAPNLWAQETDIYYNVRRYWGRVQEWVSMLLAWRQIDELIADELSVLPGMDELANLLWINNHRE